MNIAIIAGTSLIDSGFFAGVRPRKMSAGGSATHVLTGRGSVFLPRHGVGKHVLPHMIDHAAHFKALAKLGVRRVVAVNSVGSLKRAITPAHYVVPHDYIGLWSPVTVFESGANHVAPGLDKDLRLAICRAARRAGLRVIDKGVYIETPGPRFETRAEIAMLRRFGDVVGMTMASEATVAREMGMAYASLCVVDNYANGITEAQLTQETVVRSAKRKMPDIIRVLKTLLETT